MQQVNETLEQPKLSMQVPLADANAQSNEKGEDALKNLGSKEQGGAQKNFAAGKFKNEIELKKAYENLEAEFTRKSQKIKELEKLVKSFESNGESIKQAAFEKEDWPLRVAQFTQKNKFAKDYAKEICEQILSDKQLSQSKSPLEDAWARVASKNFASKSSLANDETFLNDFVFTNEKIKQRIIEDFVKEKQKSFVPTLISNGANSFAVSKKQLPKSFEEAKDELNKLFN